MSAYLVEKQSIDALVTLAFSGPSDAAGDWRVWGPGVPGSSFKMIPVTPDALGEMLYQANAEATLSREDDDWPSPYAFEPMPCEMSVVDGIKTVAYYRYQTADPDWWQDSVADLFCRWLERSLIAALPGYAEAPWGWTTQQIAARAERTRIADALRAHEPPPDDAATIIDALAASGVQLEPWTRPEPDLPDGVDRRFVALSAPKIGHWGMTRHSESGAVQLRLYTDEVSAHAGYLVRRAAQEMTHDPDNVGWVRRVARHGRAVVELAAPIRTFPGTERIRTPPAQLLSAVERLPPPDEVWSLQEAPTVFDQAIHATFVRNVVLPNGYSAGIRVARSEEGRQRVIDLVADEADQQALRAVDLERQSILMIAGVARLDDITHARIQEMVSPDDSPKHQLQLTIEGYRHTSAVIAVIDRLPVTPTDAVVHLPDVGNARKRFVVYR